MIQDSYILKENRNLDIRASSRALFIIFNFQVPKSYQLHATIFQTLITPTVQFVEGAIIFYKEGGCLLVGGPEFFGVVKGGNQCFFSGPKGGQTFFRVRGGNQTTGFSQTESMCRKAPSTNCTVSVYPCVTLTP